MLKKLLKTLGLLLILAVIFVGGFIVLKRHAAPEDGRPGPEADALAHRLAASVDEGAWARTAAVSFRFSGRHEILWDRARSLARVRWGKPPSKNIEALVDLSTKKGLATRGGSSVVGAEGDKLVADAYAWWCNDTFWLNPFAKLFDDGVERSRTTLDGQPALFYGYASGGITPGDHYLIALGSDGRPERWRMWTHVIPVGGIESRVQEWTTLATGAHLVTKWKFAGLASVVLDRVQGGETLASVEPGPDPFTALVAGARN